MKFHNCVSILLYNAKSMILLHKNVNELRYFTHVYDVNRSINHFRHILEILTPEKKQIANKFHLVNKLPL